MLKVKRVLGIIAILALLISSSVQFLVNTSPAAAETKNPYLVRTFVDEDGNEIDVIIVPGRPPEIKAAAVEVPDVHIAGAINSLSNVPAFDWSYGCSATSAAMLFGHYDLTGYSNMYAGPTNGGACPLDNSIWGVGECPLSATHMGYDGLGTKGHVDDYWYSYGSELDPYYDSVPPWTQHTYADCAADFMGTNQYQNWNNTDGSTIFAFYTNGTPWVDPDLSPYGMRDGCHGLKLFAESCGYSVVTNFNQYIYGYDENTLGFTFANFMAEIDAGRPVLIQVEGHTMLGYGYNTDGNTIYIHDTWDHSDHSMTWGETYSGLQHYGVTVIQLAELASPGEVWVDDDYTPGGYNDGHTWGYDAFAAIQDGINAVTGSTVYVAAGTYYEHITLEDGVQVLGAGASVTTIDGSYSGTVVTATNNVGSATKLDGFTITHGWAYNGGGMYNSDSSPTVTNCTFSGNRATYGGGMYNVEYSSPTVTNCTFSVNITDIFGYGGGMYNYNNSFPVVTNCTFSGNSAGAGGGVYNGFDSSLAVTNCILWGDTSGEIYNSSYVAVVTYCDIQGGYSGAGNINADPLFVNPLANDYHLQPGSPCIDVGNNLAPSLPSTDFEGDPRILDGDGDLNTVVDMGADEYVSLPNNPPNAPASPLCEGVTNPTDVTDPTPEFSWTFSDPDGGDTQGAYQVLVASSSGNLAADIGDMWDSGKVSGSAGEVSYAGTTLTDSQTYYWKVKTWDNHDAEGTYCSQQQFTTGTFPYGLLRVQTSPAVPTTILVDGIPRNAWGLDYVKMPSGEYTLSFTDTPGYLVPEVIQVTYYPGGGPTTQPLSEPIEILPDTTTEVIVNFVQLGNLWVRTDPAVPAIISLNGAPPANNWGFWVDLLPGDYDLSISDVVGYATPIEVVVTYPGQSPITQAISEPIAVEPGGTTAVVIHFIQLGNLKVETSPDLPATIFVDGNPMNDWGFWLYLEAGEYTVSFQDMDGYITPSPVVVNVTPGVTTYVTGYYVSE